MSGRIMGEWVEAARRGVAFDCSRGSAILGSLFSVKKLGIRLVLA